MADFDRSGRPGSAPPTNKTLIVIASILLAIRKPGPGTTGNPGGDEAAGR
jgi:hypothetical protein